LPGTHRIATAEYRYKTHINLYGLRYKEIPLEKPAGIFRILILGDSFAEGKGVGDNEVFSHLLEEALNKQKIYPKRCEVLNAGTDSFVPLLEYLYLKTEGIKLNPDMVIVFFDMSDLEQSLVYQAMAITDDQGEVISIPHHRLSDRKKYIIYFLRTRFYYLGAIINKINDKFSKKKIDEDIIEESTDRLLYFTQFTDQSNFKDKWEKVFKDILLIKRFCDARRINFILVIYPWGHQVSPLEWKKGRQRFGIKEGYLAPDDLSLMMERWANENNIKALNLFPSFKKYSGREPLYYDYDPHWTEYAHKLIADALLDYLREKR
jgi:lysophospholipase L1-like esterase